MAIRRLKQQTTVRSGKDALSSSPRTLVMATPTMALSLRLGGTLIDPAVEAAGHGRLIELVRALARDAARADHTADRKLAADD